MLTSDIRDTGDLDRMIKQRSGDGNLIDRCIESAHRGGNPILAGRGKMHLAEMIIRGTIRRSR